SPNVFMDLPAQAGTSFSAKGAQREPKTFSSSILFSLFPIVSRDGWIYCLVTWIVFCPGSPFYERDSLPMPSGK
ncbi:MAG TPA: hypothetical protein PKN36_01475, partial [bacterium]|nr:hypothetical protein [bacterium]